jgi:peptidoglycan/LPS O-acetylase OafA/YrhL
LLDPGAISHFAGELGFFSQVAIASLLVLPGIIPGVESGVIGLPRRVLSMRWLGWIGTISYGIYLWHEPMMSELYKLGLFNLSGSQTLNLFVAALALSIVIASVSWYLMEQPLLRRVR